MNHVVCDVCERSIPTTSSKAMHVGPVFVGVSREYGDPIDADLCSPACCADWLEQFFGPRPDFAAAKAAAQRDEMAMAGAYDNAEDVEAGLPYSPPVAS